MCSRMADQSGRRRLPPSSTPAFPGCLLSPSELDVLRLMATGLTYAAAARRTCRSTSTVRSLLHTAYRRLGVRTIAQAFAVCTHAGWLDPVPADGSIVALADRRVTWAQRLYLEAFDQFLRASGEPEEVERTQRLREAALTGLYREVGQDRPWRRAAGDPMARLAFDLRRLAPPEAA
jgi:DNA-binding CsgD family transcriptional regulator